MYNDLRIDLNAEQIKRQKRSNLALIFAGIGCILATLFSDTNSTFGIGIWYVITSVTNQIFNSRQKKNGFLSVKNGVLTLHRWILSKKVDLKDITSITYFAGEICINSSERTIKIECDQLDDENSSKVIEYLKTLPVKFEIKPVKTYTA